MIHIEYRHIVPTYVGNIHIYLNDVEKKGPVKYNVTVKNRRSYKLL